jgi:uncharacterized protein YjeT (DUF2065 family)
MHILRRGKGEGESSISSQFHASRLASLPLSRLRRAGMVSRHVGDVAAFAIARIRGGRHAGVQYAAAQASSRAAAGGRSSAASVAASSRGVAGVSSSPGRPRLATAGPFCSRAASAASCTKSPMRLRPASRLKLRMIGWSAVNQGTAVREGQQTGMQCLRGARTMGLQHEWRVHCIWW